MAEIGNFNIKHAYIDRIFDLCQDLVMNVNDLSLSLLANSKSMSPADSLNICLEFVQNKIKKYKTKYKRYEALKENPLYVPPIEMAVGTRWEMKEDFNTNVASPHLIQSTMQVVSIKETLTALFKRKDFRDAYFLGNNAQDDGDDVCGEDEFNHFVSGETYKNNELFRTNPNSIQIHLATDGFEICDPLKSRANIYNVTPIYLTIGNVPYRFLSKLNNIYLACLCNSDDLKTLQTDFNNLWEIIMRDLHYIEDVGIDIGDGIKLKGTLTAVSFDNLGGQTCLGLAESFSASFYCRICECSKEECKNMTKEDLSRYRNMEKYVKQLKIIAESVKVDYKKTHGIKRYCLLNNLRYYNMFKSLTVDIMHDINEGAMPFLTKKLFELLIFNKILSEEELITKIQFYDYGQTNKSNVPSILKLDSSNLGQNSNQMKCLFFHIPFILYKYRNNNVLKKVWICITSLLEISQIAYSHKVKESHLQTLSNAVHVHLQSIQTLFNVTLIPKHHLLTHYATIFRKMGPLIHMSMMRFEGKHKILKDYADQTNNFKNIYQTLALKHQKNIINDCSYKDEIHFGKKTFLDDDAVGKVRTSFTMSNDEDENYFEIKWLKFNNFKYKKGLIVSDGFFLYEICKIALITENVYFIVKSIEFMEKDLYSLSIKIRDILPPKYNVIDFQKLKNKQCYDKKRIGEEMFVVTDTVDLENLR